MHRHGRRLRRSPRTSAGVLLLALGVVPAPRSAVACTCVEITPAEAFARSARIFVGTVIDYEAPLVLVGHFGDMGRWRIAVSHGWKGEPLETVAVYSGIDPSGCGYRFQAGREYLVYALSRPDGGQNWPEETSFPALLTDGCARTTMLERSSQDLAWLGEPLWVKGSPPAPFLLRRNHPNPFHPRTSIPFDLSSATTVSLRIYDVTGRLVRTLVSSPLPAGRHEISWDGRGEGSETVASGVYRAELRTPEGAVSRLILLLR